jgi:N-alpha-acetyltransferase 30
MNRQGEMIGVVVSKLESRNRGQLRGYVAMLAVRKDERGKGIATKLAKMSIDAMIKEDADEVRFPGLRCERYWRANLCLAQIALETEVTNTAAMKLYERLGFLRSKRLHRYYLNGNSAFRLMLYVKDTASTGHHDGEYAVPSLTRPQNANSG